jgi:hypothetical protein
LAVDAETVADLHRYAAGEMGLATVRARALQRIAAGGPRSNPVLAED